MGRRLLNAFFTVLVSATPLLAQTYDAGDFRAAGEQSAAYQWGIGSAFLVGCLVVAFKPARRVNLR